MALTKTIEEDKIEVVGTHRVIQIRTATVITEDGTEISRNFHRRVIYPCVKSGDTWSDYDTSSESAEVQGIASAVWTSAVKTAYKASVDAQTD
tara:strand:- start:41 stop:319 length:279 start_codon:yes stop_codon:yes gene_type:complete